MSRYRKTMAEAYGSVVENSAIQMQMAALKKAYEPMRNKRISMDNANKLMKMFDKFDGNKDMLKQLYKADIPFVSGLASARLISKHNFKAQQLMQIRKEDVDKLTDEIRQINEIRKKDLEDFEEDLIGDEVNEGKMSEIDAMQKAGKSAAEIAKLMKLPVKTVKDILGEEEIHEFKKMTVTIRDMDKRKKAIADLMKQNLGVSVTGGVIKVDGKGRDLNNIAKDLMNFYSANVRAESYTIDESADEDFYNPITEACWVGYKRVGMKKKNGKMVPNCVPEETIKEELEDLMEGTGTITGFRNDKEKSNMVSLAKQHGLKTKDIPGGIELSGNMRKILDMQLAAGSHLKKEDTGYLQSKLTGQQIKNIKMTWANKKASDVTPAIKKMIKNMDIPTQLAIKAAGINHLSKLVEQDDAMTMDKDMKKKKEELPKKDDVAPDADTEKKEGENKVEKLEKELEKKDDEIAMLKTKAETEKAKTAKKETEKMVNPETGEPLLQVGIAYKHLKDKMKKKEDVKEDLNKKDKPAVMDVVKQLKGAVKAHTKQAKDLEKAMKSEADLTKPQIKMVHKKADELPKKDFKDRYGKDGDSVRYAVATNIIKKKQGIGEMKIENSKHPAKEVYESIAAVKKKAQKSGMPYGVLKKVYDRGMAAWRGGHRPGATQVQWALARVNSFVTKSSGTWGGADKDLAKQVRGSK